MGTYTLVRAICVLVLLLSLPSAAAAQRQRLFARVNTTLMELDTDPARLGTILRSWPLAAMPFGMVPLVSGRYLAWADGGNLTLFDLATGTTRAIAVSGYILGVNAEGTEVVLISQNLQSGQRTIHVVDDTLAVRSFPIPGDDCHYAIAYARDARRLMVLRAPKCYFFVPPRQWVDVVSIADGSVREEAFDVPFGYAQRIATDANGTRLWVSTEGDGFAAPAGYGLFDVATGSLLALNTSLRPETRSGTASGPTLIFDDRSNALLTVTKDGLVGLQGDTLRAVVTADAPKYRLDPSQVPPGYDPAFGYQVLAHPDATAVYVFERSGITRDYHGGPCLQSALIALDPQTAKRLATRNLATAEGSPICGVWAVMTVAPAAPPNFTASVMGRRVTLTWDPPPQATHYELEVGSARGLRDIAIITPTSVPYVVDGVPSGTYYVRLRALSYAGKGAYTEDVVVVVP